MLNGLHFNKLLTSLYALVAYSVFYEAVYEDM